MTSALRVLMVSDVSPCIIRGGAERVLWEQASRLVMRGHRVRIMSRAPDGDAAETVGRQGVGIQYFPVDRRSPLRFIRSAMLEVRRTVLRELAQGGADVLHLHQPLSGYGVLRSRAGRELPSLYTFHSPAPLEYLSRRGMTGLHRGGWAGSVGMALLWLIEGACLRRATRIHVLSDFSTDLLWKLYRIPADRIVKISGGVDTEQFRPAMDRSAVRDILGLPVGRPLLFTLRNLEARMGLDTLIAAMVILRRHLPEALLLIGGTGSLRGELEALTASLDLHGQVRFLGRIPDAQLPLYYQAADVFVLPTRALEGFGLVTVEALACGTPVLGTPVGATPEILDPLDRRLVFRDTTPETMAEDLRRFLAAQGSDPVAGQCLREACRRYTERYYTWDQSVSSLEAELGRLAERQENSPVPPLPCRVCGAPTLEASLFYQGRRYQCCVRCRTGVVATLPTTARLRHHYEIEYPRQFPHERIAEPRRELFASLLDHLQTFRKPERLLDVGCGGGHLLVAAARRGCRILGVDLSHQACTAAHQASGLPVVQADSARLPWRDACIDTVTLINVLDHTADPLGALHEAYRVLATGGHLVVRIPNAAFHRPWVRLLTALGPLVRWYGWDGYPILHLFTFTAGALRYVVERAGFRILEIRNSTPAVEGSRRSHTGRGNVVWRWVHQVIIAGAASVEALSRGRWLVGPSLELYACKGPPLEEKIAGEGRG